MQRNIKLDLWLHISILQKHTLERRHIEVGVSFRHNVQLVFIE